MRRIWIFLSLLGGMAAAFLLPASAYAGKTNAADFPLRVHIVDRNGIRHYHGMGGGIHTLDEVDGMGQGNLFENGQALGFDFTYNCSQPIIHQSAFETFMARWKKPGREIEILQPVIGGKPGQMSGCDLNVTLKQGTVYRSHNGALVEEPAAEYKQWMTVHQYDPEHGKDMPVGLDGGAAQPAPGAGAPN